MGAPKQKWTPEEEAALKAGIKRYGIGKWSTILKDPEFGAALRARSNVDLKDKWRNLNCMATGLGSRHRPRVSHRNASPTPKNEGDTAASGVAIEKVPEDHATQEGSSEASPKAAPRIFRSRLDEMIMEAIKKLKEPRGSSRAAIERYLEENYPEPVDFETMTAHLKELTENRRLIKVKNQYRLAPNDPSVVLEMMANMERSEEGRKGVVRTTKAKIDAELEKMKKMSAQEAAEAAAKAVAEAEAAVREAEAAAKEAEEAEAEAEAALCFHAAAQKALDMKITIYESLNPGAAKSRGSSS